jgi:hypothetical protein
VVYPIIHRVSTIQGDAGFLPSTVCIYIYVNCNNISSPHWSFGVQFSKTNSCCISDSRPGSQQILAGTTDGAVKLPFSGDMHHVYICVHVITCVYIIIYIYTNTGVHNVHIYVYIYYTYIQRIDVCLMYPGRFQSGSCQWGIRVPGDISATNSSSDGILAPTFKSCKAMQPETCGSCQIYRTWDQD